LLVNPMPMAAPAGHRGAEYKGGDSSQLGGDPRRGQAAEQTADSERDQEDTERAFRQAESVDDIEHQQAVGHGLGGRYQPDDDGKAA